MNIFCILDFYTPLFSDVYEVLSCLGEEGGVGDFFGVVVPVPDFYSVVCAVGEDGRLPSLIKVPDLKESAIFRVFFKDSTP